MRLLLRRDADAASHREETGALNIDAIGRSICASDGRTVAGESCRIAAVNCRDNNRPRTWLQPTPYELPFGRALKHVAMAPLTARRKMNEQRQPQNENRSSELCRRRDTTWPAYGNFAAYPHTLPHRLAVRPHSRQRRLSSMRNGASSLHVMPRDEGAAVRNHDQRRLLNPERSGAFSCLSGVAAITLEPEVGFASQAPS
jgi:hypothetical protein